MPTLKDESPVNQPSQGLRERKKAKTRAVIQRHALCLFREQGYEATTISQIAEAAEISESTFFRYFPTKEAIVRWDEFDLPIVAAFRAQPAHLTPIAALRAALHSTLGELSAEERAELHDRIALVMSILPHSMMGTEQLAEPMRALAEAVAARVVRTSDDFAVRALVGAVMGVGIAAMFAAAEQPQADVVALLDDGLSRLEFRL